MYNNCYFDSVCVRVSVCACTVWHRTSQLLSNNNQPVVMGVVVVALITAHIHTYTYMHTYIHTYKQTNTHTHTYITIHTYIHTYTHTHIHAYIHTYIQICLACICISPSQFTKAVSVYCEWTLLFGNNNAMHILISKRTIKIHKCFLNCFLRYLSNICDFCYHQTLEVGSNPRSSGKHSRPSYSWCNQTPRTQHGDCTPLHKLYVWWWWWWNGW